MTIRPYIRLTVLTFFMLVFSNIIIGAENTVIESRDLSLTLTKTDKGGIAATSIKDKKSGQELLLPDASWLFTVQLQETGSKKIHFLNSKENWKKVSVRQVREDQWYCRWELPKNVPGAEKLFVEMTIEATASQAGMNFYWDGKTNDNALSFRQGNMFALEIRKFGERQKLCYPQGPGRIADKPIENGFVWSSPYPRGIACTMPWFALWDEASKQGLYFGDHDPFGSYKTLTFRSNKEKTGAKIIFEHFFENMGLGNNRITVPGKIHLASLDGDWFDAARYYRHWVQKEAKWMPPMGPDGRTDIPLWMKENCVWVMASTDQRWLTVTRYTYTPLS